MHENSVKTLERFMNLHLLRRDHVNLLCVVIILIYVLAEASNNSDLF